MVFKLFFHELSSKIRFCRYKLKENCKLAKETPINLKGFLFHFVLNKSCNFEET